MKLKTRLATAFLAITIVPLFLIFICVLALSNYQSQSFTKTYGLNEQVQLLNNNSLQLFNRLTQKVQEEIQQSLISDPANFENQEYLSQLNERLKTHYSYLIVRKHQSLIFIGDESLKMNGEKFFEMLPENAVLNSSLAGGIYLDGDSQHLIKQMDFLFPDGSEGSLFIVSRVDDFVPEVKSMVIEMFASGISILLVTGIFLTMWIYRSILKPLGKLQVATKIKTKCQMGK